MSLRIGQVTVNSTDASALAAWWAGALGGRVVAENDGWFVVVDLGVGPALAVQRTGDPTPGRNRLHLDLVADDLDAEVARLRAAGAGDVRDETMENGFRWVTLTDPDGNEFCVSGPH